MEGARTSPVALIAPTGYRATHADHGPRTPVPTAPGLATDLLTSERPAPVKVLLLWWSPHHPRLPPGRCQHHCGTHRTECAVPSCPPLWQLRPWVHPESYAMQPRLGVLQAEPSVTGHCDIVGHGLAPVPAHHLPATVTSFPCASISTPRYTRPSSTRQRPSPP